MPAIPRHSMLARARPPVAATAAHRVTGEAQSAGCDGADEHRQRPEQHSGDSSPLCREFLCFFIIYE